MRARPEGHDVGRRTDDPLFPTGQVDQQRPLGDAETIDNVVVVVVGYEMRKSR